VGGDHSLAGLCGQKMYKCLGCACVLESGLLWTVGACNYRPALSTGQGWLLGVQASAVVVVRTMLLALQGVVRRLAHTGFELLVGSQGGQVDQHHCAGVDSGWSMLPRCSSIQPG